MREKFQPVSNTPPTGLLGAVKFYGRMLVDFQALTIYRDVKKHLPAYEGDILDIGCGQSAYKFLLNEKKTRYVGIDIPGANKFGYSNPDIVLFDGKTIPFENEKFDAVICTEVLEHVQDYRGLAGEIHRIAKKNADILITVPWSARYHYIPDDYFRFTPSSLQQIFSVFSTIKIKNRGTDFSVLTSKIIIIFFRGFFPDKPWKYVFLPFYIGCLQILAVFLLFGYVALEFNLGSPDDPLGYTIILKK